MTQATAPKDKICTVCGVPKPWGEFYLESRGKGLRRADCRDCCRERWKIKNRKRRAAAARQEVAALGRAKWTTCATCGTSQYGPCDRMQCREREEWLPVREWEQRQREARS